MRIETWNLKTGDQIQAYDYSNQTWRMVELIGNPYEKVNRLCANCRIISDIILMNHHRLTDEYAEVIFSEVNSHWWLI